MDYKEYRSMSPTWQATVYKEPPVMAMTHYVWVEGPNGEIIVTDWFKLGGDHEERREFVGKLQDDKKNLAKIPQDVYFENMQDLQDHLNGKGFDLGGELD